MSTRVIISKLLDDLKKEINTPDNTQRFRNDIIKPLVAQVIEELYPYMLGVIGVSVGVVFMIFVILLLNIKICYKS